MVSFPFLFYEEYCYRVLGLKGSRPAIWFGLCHLLLSRYLANTIPEIGIAVVGAGVRLGNLARELYAQGERALPHGVCPGVGVGGHFTHGGYGYQSRAWGLALDSIVGLDVILADGSFVHATAERHHEVFFAMRGAADSFGVVTTFYLQTRAAPTSIVTFSANIPDALNDPEKLAVGFSPT